MKKLFAVYLGGKAPGANIEVHDLVFVVSASIKTAFPKLRELWFGTKSSAHVDSWIDLSYIDGHRVDLIRVTSGDQEAVPPGPRLFMINIGSYARELFGEQHRFHFLVCRDRNEAKSRARRLSAKEALQAHLDNVVEIDDLLEIAQIDGYRPRLTPAEGFEPEIENVYWPLKARRRS